MLEVSPSIFFVFVHVCVYMHMNVCIYAYVFAVKLLLDYCYMLCEMERRKGMS